MSSFKKLDLATRRRICDRESRLHPDKMPVIIELHPKFRLETTRNFRMMVRKQCTIFQLIQLLLKEMQRTKEKAFVESSEKKKRVSYTLAHENHLLDGGKVLNTLEEMQSKEDGFLYLQFGQLDSF